MVDHEVVDIEAVPHHEDHDDLDLQVHSRCTLISHTKAEHHDLHHQAHRHHKVTDLHMVDHEAVDLVHESRLQHEAANLLDHSRLMHQNQKHLVTGTEGFSEKEYDKKAPEISGAFAFANLRCNLQRCFACCLDPAIFFSIAFALLGDGESVLE